MNFNFTDREKCAIVKIVKLLASADEKIAEEERIVLALESVRIGLTSENVEKIENDANNLEAVTACNIISNMTASEKQYVAAMLGSLMAIDGDIDDSEMKLLQLVFSICDLPRMNVAQAFQYMSTL